MRKTPVKAPGKSHREGITLIGLMNMFPTEEVSTEWFESVLWPGGRCCGHCGSTSTSAVPNAKPMPYWCTDCRSYFSVRTGTALERTKVPLRKWAIAIYLELTSLKSVSSMKLHRDLGVRQSTAWFMLHRSVSRLDTASGRVRPGALPQGALRRRRQGLRISRVLTVDAYGRSLTLIEAPGPLRPGVAQRDAGTLAHERDRFWCVIRPPSAWARSGHRSTHTCADSPNVARTVHSAIGANPGGSAQPKEQTSSAALLLTLILPFAIHPFFLFSFRSPLSV